MIARTQSFILQGVEALPCEVEVHIELCEAQKDGVIVGLPDAAVKESRDRVQSAITNSGYFRPAGKPLINLAPADVRKEGPVYDLPIAVCMLMVQGIIKHKQRDPTVPDHRKYFFAGELALDGRVRPVKGVIALAALAHKKGAEGVIVPAANAAEASVVEGLTVLGVHTLTEVVGLLNGEIEPEPHPLLDVADLIARTPAQVDFKEVRGQEVVKRALVVAAAGAHNIVMLGPAGSGKTMMAKALPGVLPALAPEEAIAITRIYSAAGLLSNGSGLMATRPVRSPHHTASGAAVIGGGVIPRPGEISLAHNGILFLDELAEFPRHVLETLRQPMEDHVVTIARAHAAVRFPASFMLVAAMNPTPKGDMPVGEQGHRDMEKYLSRLSGPLVDRIDIHVEAPAVPWEHLSSAPRGTDTATMRDQVQRARSRQADRQDHTCNARLSGRQLDELAPMTKQARAMLGQALTELGLSARAYDKIRRIGRTIADLENVDEINETHICEAVGYRLLDRSV